MPLQNRVTPSGEIVADPSRGLLMGNRGCLHGPGRTLGVSRWRSKLWICCLLDYKGVRRDPMPPGRWTALFFLDEATALAAGHRPCGYCRRADYLAFAEAWRAARHLPRRPGAAEMVPAQAQLPRPCRRTARRRHGPGRRRARPAHRRPGAALVLPRLRCAGPRRSRRPGRGADATLDRRRDHRWLPATGAPKRRGRFPAGRPLPGRGGGPCANPRDRGRTHLTLRPARPPAPCSAAERAARTALRLRG